MSVCVGEKVFENTWSPVSTSYGCERGGVRVYLDLEQSGLLADGHRDVTSTSIIFWFLRYLFLFLNGRQAGRQAAPTCYMDRSKDHRISLDRSNSFLHPSCPYWFGPFPPRCAPVALIKHKSFIPHRTKHKKREREEGEEERDKERTKERDNNFRHSLWRKKVKQKRKKEEKLDATTYVKDLGHVVSTYLLHGHMKSPQHFPKSFKFFSASFMSWLIWFMPSSTRSSCSGQDKGMTVVEWISLTGWQKYELWWAVTESCVCMCVCVAGLEIRTELSFY